MKVRVRVRVGVRVRDRVRVGVRDGVGVRARVGVSNLVHVEEECDRHGRSEGHQPQPRRCIENASDVPRPRVLVEAALCIRDALAPREEAPG
eukprot:scaffold12175_cov33-Phaeocystis_antarctica.AAC.1